MVYTAYGNSQAQNALAVVAKWMGKMYNLKVEYHNGTAVDADIFNGVIRIPRLATSNALTDETLNLLRGRIYHEAGHIFDAIALRALKDKGKYPSGILFEIFNSVEDCRMERSVIDRHPGAEPVFKFNWHYHNQKIAEAVAEGTINKPIWEALVACMFRSRGITPKWRLSEKAQKYFDSAYDKFTEWKDCITVEDTVDLAKEIYEILKDTHEKHEQEKNENNQNNSDDDQEQDEQEQESGEGEGSNGGSDDSDDTESGDDENEDGKSQGGQGDFDDEDSDDENGQGQGSSNDFDDESAENELGGNNSMESENDANDNVDKGGSGNGDDDQEGDSDNANENNQIGGGKSNSDFETEDERNARLEEEMAEEADGISLIELQDADIEKALGELDDLDKEYLSDKSKDEHNMIEPRDWDIQHYQNTRSEVSSAVTSMANALLQALRARTRCRKNPYQKRGKIDTRQLVAISKGLSKDVFYTTKQGEKLDTAVEIIIDESMSMSNEVVETRKLALAIAEVLTQLNIPFEITGTTTKYRASRCPDLNGLDRTNPLVYNHYKTFDQSWNSCKHAIMQTGSHEHNVDGEAVEHCARRLLNRPESRKIVLSLSDGEPFSGQSHTKTEQNLIYSCEKARKNGVEVYGFGIDTFAPRRYYGADNFIHLPGGKMDIEFTKAFVKIVSGGQLYV
jgi:ribosomal protein L11